jgi:hypothetical protein
MRKTRTCWAQRPVQGGFSCEHPYIFRLGSPCVKYKEGKAIVIKWLQVHI